MEAAGLSQAELARRVGLAQPTIFNLIHRSKKGSTHIHKIARELGTTPAYLSGEVDDPQADAPPPPELSHAEMRWIAFWRAMSSGQRRAMVQLAEEIINPTPERVDA